MNKFIKDTLTPIGLPVHFLVNPAPQAQFITFSIYNETGEAWADNSEQMTNYYVQVNVFSKTDYTSIVSSVVENMLGAGFKRTSAVDLYESDTKYYHKSLRFFYQN